LALLCLIYDDFHLMPQHCDTLSTLSCLWLSTLSYLWQFVCYGSGERKLVRI